MLERFGRMFGSHAGDILRRFGELYQEVARQVLVDVWRYTKLNNISAASLRKNV